MDRTDVIACLAFFALCAFLISMDLNQEVEVKMCTHDNVLTYVGLESDNIPESIGGKLGKCEVKSMIKEEFYEIKRIWRRSK